MKKSLTAALMGVVFFGTTPVVLGTMEHAGAEHAGEHAKKKAKVAHVVTAGEIKTAMRDHIDRVQKKGKGVFKLVDRDDKKKKLRLEFVKIHDPVRKIEGRGYFACTDFRPVDGPKGQLYDLDFWLKPDKKGKLKVTETKVHKHPELKGGKWVKHARYTFVNDKPVVIK